ncbi:MAG TPA: hypothetical protein VFY93_00035 [Planctomycetota bacterium]|nr:hypothetical protein [Planctomycetota bacterium]
MNATLDQEIFEARLCYDSAADGAGGTRGFGGQPRMLLFKWERLVVDLLLCDRTALCALHGRVTENPTGSPVVGAAARAGTAIAETDEHGQFVVMLDDEWTPRKVSIRTRGYAVICPIPD